MVTNSNLSPLNPTHYNQKEFLQKSLEVKVNNSGREYTIIYKKNPEINKIVIESINYKKDGKTIASDDYHLKDKAFKVDDMVEFVKKDSTHPIGSFFKEILDNEGQIVLGLTDIGHVDPHGKYHETAANNIDVFSALVEKQNYQSWAEMEKWNTGTADWRDVIMPRFDIIRKIPDGKIHFNLTGMTKENIIKSLQLNFNVPTGESALNWGKNATPSGTWKEQFGSHGLTYWELMQVIRDPDLLKKTDFYIYENEASATSRRLTPAILKLDFGINLEKLTLNK